MVALSHGSPDSVGTLLSAPLEGETLSVEPTDNILILDTTLRWSSADEILKATSTKTFVFSKPDEENVDISQSEKLQRSQPSGHLRGTSMSKERGFGDIVRAQNGGKHHRGKTSRLTLSL